MEIIPKQGYLIAEYMTVEGFDLNAQFHAAKVVAGVKDIGINIFFKDYMELTNSGNLILIKIDDVLAWIKPEEKADEPKNDQA